MMPSRKVLWTALLAITIVKTLFFTLFIVDRNPQIIDSFVVEGVALKGGDTETYYYPLRNLIKDGEYTGMCRMPGLAPVYLPFRVFLSHEQTQIAIVYLQLVVDIVAALLCSILCFRIFRSTPAFWLCAALTTLSPFVLVRANYLLSDSFCCSALVLAAWFLYEFIQSRKTSTILICGAFLAWAVFLRQISLLVLPCFLLILFTQLRAGLTQRLRYSILLFIPLSISIAAWGLRNTIKYNRTVLLVPPITECMGQLTPEFYSVRKLLLTMGQDTQPWKPGSASHWFFTESADYPCPISERHFTPTLTRDSIIDLRTEYWSHVNDSIKNNITSEQFVRECIRHEKVYINENSFNFYIVNRVQFFFQFMFPTTIDDLPVPRLSEASLLSKATKVSGYFLLLAIHAIFLLALIYFLVKRNSLVLIWSLFGLLPILFLSYKGWIEQRYLATSHYFLILICSGFMAEVAGKLRLFNRGN
jgi:hypothetical protein